MSEETGYPQGWKPSPGDEISGRVVDISATDNGYGAYPVVTLEDEGGTQVAVHAFHDVLKNELARRRPKLGDVVGIKYLGQPNGKRYHAYRVSGGQAASFDWGAFTDEAAVSSADPPIVPSQPFTGPGGVAPAEAGPLPAQPSVQERAAESFGSAVPF